MADELDDLYRVKPGEFTALRTKLAAAARKGGDAAEAKRISGARKPTTAAWVVNNLVGSDDDVRGRLSDLGDRLRAAHSTMDGPRIRELSAEQRRLIDELEQAAFDAAGQTDPSAALREDVTSTLQAAIADPEVRSRLGRLVRAEQWSGFGDFGDATPVLTASRSGKTKSPPPQPQKASAEIEQRDEAAEAARRRRAEASAALTAAEHSRAEADDAVSERKTDLATARLRVDAARSRLEEAEHQLEAAESDYDAARQASHGAAERVREAGAQLTAA
ncbi:MAG: hypothetical protein JWO57_2066, partial [Pseudonocardiales bacterium]|nr:hypothetical protein [Pseudonocardiales bacterium]